MITLELTGNERLQFHFILPAKGSLDTLEKIERILTIIKSNDVKEIENIEKFEFSKDDITFLKTVISILDQSQNLSFQSLSLIRKIMNIKEQNI